MWRTEKKAHETQCCNLTLVSFAFCQQHIKSYPGAGAVSDLNNERGLYIII